MLLYLQFEIDISICCTMSNVSTYIGLVCLLVVVCCDNNVTGGTDVIKKFYRQCFDAIGC